MCFVLDLEYNEGDGGGVGLAYHPNSFSLFF